MGDVINNYRTVRISIVHGSQGLISLLACRIPDLKLDRRVLVQRNRLCEEGGTDGGFPVRIKLILSRVSRRTSPSLPILAHLNKAQYYRTLAHSRFAWMPLARQSPIPVERAGLTEEDQLELCKPVAHATRTRGSSSGHFVCVMGRFGAVVAEEGASDGGTSMSMEIGLRALGQDSDDRWAARPRSQMEDGQNRVGECGDRSGFSDKVGGHNEPGFVEWLDGT